MDYAGIILRIIGCKKNRELFQNNRFLLLCAHACNPRYACVVLSIWKVRPAGEMASEIGSSDSEIEEDMRPIPSSSVTSDGDASSCADTNYTESSSSGRGVTSLLSKLRAPLLSDLARKRKVRSNPPTGVKRGKGAAVVANPKGVGPADRVRTYPAEPFSVSNKRLFCMACREELATKKSIIDLHIKSVKHSQGKRRLASTKKHDQDIINALGKYDEEFHPEGESLLNSTRLYRIKVVTTMLKAGVPLNKVDAFRDLLEESSYALTSATNLRQLLPFIRHQELDTLKRKISNRPLSIIFDGTTHVCEALVIVVRYISDSWEIQQRVCRLMLLAKSVTGEELARQIITVLSTELGIPSHQVMGAMRDRASVNDVALRTVTVIYNNLLDIGCFSHTIDHVGEKMKTPVLDEFSKGWINIFSRSPKARLSWRARTGVSPCTYSPTRWWSRFEVLRQLHDTFGDIAEFLESDVTSSSAKSMLEILQDPPKSRKLQIELAITMDAMDPFVRATYLLEGDGPLALSTYERLMTLVQAMNTEHYPNVAAVARKLANGDPRHEQQLITYAKSCVSAAYAYFKGKFERDLQPAVLAFKAARFFSPHKICELKPSAADIDMVRSIPFLNSQEVLNDLKTELPAYLAAAEDVSPEIDTLHWWKAHESTLPKWAEATRKVLLLQPSSAAAERVFSILSNSFSSHQDSSLEDYIELSVMLQYNKRV